MKDVIISKYRQKIMETVKTNFKLTKHIVVAIKIWAVPLFCYTELVPIRAKTIDISTRKLLVCFVKVYLFK